MRKQVKGLEHESNLGSNAVDVLAMTRDFLVSQPNSAPVRYRQLVDTAKQGAFPRSRGAYHNLRFPAAHLQGHPAQYMIVTVRFMQVFDLQNDIARDAGLGFVHTIVRPSLSFQSRGYAVDSRGIQEPHSRRKSIPDRPKQRGSGSQGCISHPSQTVCA